MKRLLSCQASEMLNMNGKELKQAIMASEGRIVITETVVACSPLLGRNYKCGISSCFGS